jgi:hypothetical protein
VPALVIALNWLRLERPGRDGGRMLLLVALAVAPALAPRLRQRIALLAGAAIAATAVAVRVDPGAVFERHHAYFGPLGSRVGNGVLSFYDVQLPFNPWPRSCSPPRSRWAPRPGGRLHRWRCCSSEPRGPRRCSPTETISFAAQ